MGHLGTLKALYEATRSIGLADDLDGLLDDVLRRAQELIGFDHGALMLYEESDRSLRVRRVRGYGDRAEDVRGLVLPLGTGLTGWAAAHREAVRVPDVREDPRYVAGLPECRSNLAVPLVVANEVAGVINVESERCDAFTAEHEKLLTVLGSQAALAILAARARGRLRERIQELDALFRISQLASNPGDLEGILDAILEVTEELVPEGRVALLLRDRTTDCLRVRAARGYLDGVELLRIPPGVGITGRCVELGHPVVVPDIREDPGYIPGIEGARCEIALPLKVEGKVIGVLNAESSRPAAYPQDQVRVLTVIAHQAAVVIRSSELNEEARRLAITDALTGLHNRRYFVDKLEEHLGRARRYDQRLGLILVDSDHLKSVNDEHGHLTGDRALQTVADALRSAFRETDELARIGGDEFAAVLLEAGPDRTRALLSRFRETVRDLTISTPSGAPIRVSVSAGIAFFPDDGTTATELLRAADLALYGAKREGRGRMARAAS